MTRDQILRAIRSTASDNGGRPLGERAFRAETGISRSEFFATGFSRYSEAVEAAGLQPNELIKALDAGAALGALAELTRRLRRFPAQSDLKVARREEPTLPSYEALNRISGGWSKHLREMLWNYCREHSELADVAEILASDVLRSSTEGKPGSAKHARVVGYVYLAKHGRDYKIGRSNDVTRRRRELALLLPQELEHVHIIETDDPEGIERYWHRRFKERLIRGEWYRLRPEDVAAFRRRRYQ